MIELNSAISQLNRVGKATSSRLKKLGIEIVSDLIFYYPFRYDDFSLVSKIEDIEPGSLVTVRGTLELIASRRSSRKRRFLTEGLVTDDTGSVKVIWFNQPWISKTLNPGDEISLSGKVTGDMNGLSFNSPEYEKIKEKSVHTAKVVPIYSLTEGITQKQIRFLIDSVGDLISLVKDYIPTPILKKESLLSLSSALNKIHFPKNQKDIDQARNRLAFDELFLIQLWSKILKKRLGQLQSYKIKFFEKQTKEFVSSLDFKLTDDQRKSAWEAIGDMTLGKPMNRLLEGDVGSGKTLVAAIAAYNVALNKKQVAFLVPTGVLATQHFDTISNLFKNKIVVGLLTRTNRVINGEKVSKKEFLKQCANGLIDMVIGTHAIIQKDVGFDNLALVVVDEQHRFGVSQREALKQKSKKIPHFLSLTATPIPRSLALTIYGDLDLSIIKQVPSGRKVVITRVVDKDDRHKAYEFIRKQIAEGRQVFVVCPLIDQSDSLGVRSVNEEFEKLNNIIFPDLPIGLLHGKLKSVEKEEAMSDFVSGKTKILVSTSVIEVGVDVKNATVMMIEGADRFGLAQLHQFRGRVGRNNYQSYCFLFSDSQDEKTIQRLDLIVRCNDGFELASQDLKYRGAGQVYGYQQSGFSDLKIASLDDLELAKKASLSAQDFVDNYELADYPMLQEKIDKMDLNTHLE